MSKITICIMAVDPHISARGQAGIPRSNRASPPYRVLMTASVPSNGKKKKADVVEHPQGFDHVGLLVDEPPGAAGLLFT